MPTHQIQHRVEADGRILLEDLPIRRGQRLRITLETEDEPFTLAPPVSDADLAIVRDRLRRAVISESLDPEDSLVEPSEWDSFAE